MSFNDFNCTVGDYGVPIDFVGITDLSVPVHLTDEITALSKVDIFVSLEDKKTRGIHMSRLYLSLHDYFLNSVVSLHGLKQLLKKIIKNQRGLSSSGRIRLKSNWPVLRKSLKSSLSGWREYPVCFEVTYLKVSGFKYSVGGEVIYSSTCPCSAFLSRQVIKQDFIHAFSSKRSFSKQEMLEYFSDKKFLSATPHAQRSKAFFKLQLKENLKPPFSFLQVIDDVEKTLGTSVQVAVKKEDEAEFAKLNAANLMFCEDAVRKLAVLFKNKSWIIDFVVRVRHYESLHPFTVESSLAKGLKGGWKA